MKILIVNTYDIRGGAAKAAYRLHQALNQSGLSSTMIVKQKYSSDDSVIQIEDSHQGRSAFFDSLPYYTYKKDPHVIFSSAMVENKPLLEFINSSDADVVHIHWTGNGFISIEDIAKINKPIIFSLHDMWLFTGGCHYTQNCNRYRSSCKYCPALLSTQADDLSALNFNRKQWLFNLRSDITIVGLSQWIASEAKSSPLLKNNQIEQIPNAIDTKVFHAIPKYEAKLKVDIPVDEPIILFAADGGTRDPRKGYKYLEQILSFQLSKQHFHVITVGNQIESKHKQEAYTLHHFPAIENEHEMVLLLNAADIVVLPSQQENLSNLVLESLSCGTPVIAFDIGGNSDMIEHLENGYLAKFEDSQDLAKGVIWGLSHQFQPEKIRQHILDKFSYDVIAAKYLSLYRSVQHENTQSHIDIIPPTLLVENESNFEWTTTALETWITSINKLNKPCIIYGFGILGRYLQKRTTPNCQTVIDLNYKALQPQYSEVQFSGLDYLNDLTNTLIVISIYDPNNTIKSEIESRIGKNCLILNVLEDNFTA